MNAQKEDPFAMFAAWLDGRPGLAAEFARYAEVSESSVSRWRKRLAIPSPPVARLIERRAGIRRALWEPLRAKRRAA